MKKKIILILFVLVLAVAGFIAYMVFGPAVKNRDKAWFYINTGDDVNTVKQNLIKEGYIDGSWFDIVARSLKYKNAKAGRYKPEQGMSLYRLIKMLRSGDQVKINFVITKLRTKEALASRTGQQFEFDSLQMIRFLNNPDSLRPFGLDTNTVMSVAMPFTYSVNWNTTPGKVFRQFVTAWQGFWNEERKQKADSLHLTPVEISTLASIVEEETLKKQDKYNIASTYLNRIRVGMPLQADPTVKFAMKDFGLRRITGVHLKTVSPYNTYLNAGLPPGPICTPSVETIDAVLNAPKTDYLYFVASSNFDGTSVFTTNLSDHSKYARAYQQALTKRLDSLKKVK